jgi:hypothetical protein
VPTPPPTSTSVTLTPAEEELYGPRVELPGGLLQKQLGKVAQYGGPDDNDNSTWGFRVVVDSIEVDPKCDQYAAEPTRGRWLLISLRVETSQLYDAARDGSAPGFYEWSTIGPDGITEPPLGSGSPCRAATELLFELRPGAKYRGTVGIDTANPSGQLLLSNIAWKYPA